MRIITSTEDLEAAEARRDKEYPLAAKVRDLEEYFNQHKILLGEIIATFSIPMNRELIGQVPELLEYCDKCIERYDRINQRE